MWLFISQSSLQLITQIFDSDHFSGDGPEKNSDMRDDIVDKITAEPAFVIQEEFSVAKKFTGAFSSIEFRFRLSCTSNHYGYECSTFCMDKNDENGHYACDSNGNKICVDGYTDSENNCTEGEHCWCFGVAHNTYMYAIFCVGCI